MYLGRRHALLKDANTDMVSANACQNGLNVVIASDDGIRKTMLWSASKTEADGWIARASRMARPGTPPKTFDRRIILLMAPKEEGAPRGRRALRGVRIECERARARG